MIFPLLKGILFPLRVPATFLITLLNIVVFLLCLDRFERSQNGIERILSDHEMLVTQGLTFSQYIEAHPQDFQILLRSFAKKSLDGDRHNAHQMGGLAIRNANFMKAALDFEVNGNEISIAHWRKQFKEILTLQQNHPSYYLGLNYNHNTVINWLSYQFTHSGLSHLFWNMLFLVLLGCFVESEVGSAVLVFTFLSAGLMGAFTFSVLSGISAIPLVGASASISGLVGFIIVHHWRQKIDFFFWLLPLQNYFGLTKLPAGLLLIIFCLPDVAGQLASVSEFGSIAYSAHLGGALMGIGVGLAYRYWPNQEPMKATL